MNDSVGAALAWGQAELREKSPSARLDAEILLTFITGLSKVAIFSHPERVISKDEFLKFKDAVRRRKSHEPVAYITGTKEFFGLAIHVTPDVLVPRPETELLVEEALRVSERVEGVFKVLDLGTGSGCIPIAIAQELKKRGKRCHCVGIDRSYKALLVANINKRNFEMGDSINFFCSNWLNSVGHKFAFDCIVANPPYIPTKAKLAPDLSFEPAAALFAGADGMDALRSILSELPSHITARGVFLSEIGHDQGDRAELLWQELGLPTAKIEVIRDLANQQRIIKISH